MTVVPVEHSTRLSLVRRMRPLRRSVLGVIRELAPDVVHAHEILAGGAVLADVSSAPTVLTGYGHARMDTVKAQPTLRGTLRATVQDLFCRMGVRRADVCVSAHPSWRINLPVQPKRFVHIPSIVDDCFFATSHNPEPGRVLYCGGERLIKGWDVLVDAWPQVRQALPTARLTLLGWDDPAAAADRIRADTTIRVLRDLAPRQLAGEMARSEVVVIPSRYEVAPLVLAEAWAVGVPVVATTAGGLTELGERGALLVPAEDSGRLADALIRALKGHAETAPFVAEGIRRAPLHGASAVAQAHIRLYESL